MNLYKTDRGFEVVDHLSYGNTPMPLRLVSQSSAIGDYEDSFDRPGTSFLWVGDNHHLNREEVAELRDRLTAWLATGTLRNT